MISKSVCNRRCILRLCLRSAVLSPRVWECRGYTLEIPPHSPPFSLSLELVIHKRSKKKKDKQHDSVCYNFYLGTISCRETLYCGCLDSNVSEITFTCYMNKVHYFFYFFFSYFSFFVSFIQFFFLMNDIVLPTASYSSAQNQKTLNQNNNAFITHPDGILKVFISDLEKRN